MKRNLILSVCMLSFLFGCENGPVRMSASGFTQGTTYNISYYSTIDHQYQIDSVLLAFDRVLSTYQENSYISKWNRNEAEGLEVPGLFLQVIERSIEMNELTNGAFDITVKPIYSFWFENNWKLTDLDSSMVDSLMLFVGSSHLKMTDSGLEKDDPRVQLDVNAIAQGFSVDVVSRYLESNGVYNYIVEIGGEIRAHGKKDDDWPWKVGIERPDLDENRSRTIQLDVILEDRSLATSGNYRKYLEVDGEKYGHVLNPVSGYPAKTDVLSSTVFASDCMTADALATACMVLRFENAKELIEADPELDAILIYGDGEEVKTWMSPGVKDLIGD